MDTNAHPLAIQYIESASDLEDFCRRIEKSEWLAVDTEFLRENTYFPKFCLLQIANIEQAACIDPLKIDDLSPLFEILYDPSIVKIFHSARQDLEIFYNLREAVPGPVFDTQIAAPLLGFTDQISYATLVSSLLGVDLNKAHTRTDWSERPLSPSQLDYAGGDVYYLARIYVKMREQLQNLGRLEWLADDFAALLDPEIYRSQPDKAWLRVRGAKHLHGVSLGVLQNLADWRERTAFRQNVPRNWVIRDDLLLAIARLQPAQPDELKILRGLPERIWKRYSSEICEIVEKARRAPPIPSNLKAEVQRKSAAQEVLTNFLIGVVQQIALENSLSPAILCPKKDLDLLVIGDPDSKLLRGWRKAIVGETLQAILRGEKIVSIDHGMVRLEPRPNDASSQIT